jgi:hypothetical protein
MLPVRNSQKAFGVLYGDIRRVAKKASAMFTFHGTAFHGRGSASGVRLRRLVDAAWRVFLGRITDLMV